MKHLNFFTILLSIVLFASCNNGINSDIEDDFGLLETEKSDYSSVIINNQEPKYEGLWKMENNLGIKAVLLTDGIIKEKDVESSSFSQIATYEECGNITIQENGELITITILKLFPSSLTEREPAYSYWGVYPSEMNGTQSIKIYTFNENPILQDLFTPIDNSCYSKVGDIYLSKKERKNNNRDVISPYLMWLYSMCSTNEITLAYFYAIWSGPCHLQTPIVNSFADDHYDDLGFCHFDVDLVPDICEEYNISYPPTCLFLDSNAFVLARITGVTTYANLELVYSSLTSD